MRCDAASYFDKLDAFTCCVNFLKSQFDLALAGPLCILLRRLSEIPLKNLDIVFMRENFASFIDLFSLLDGTSSADSRAELCIGLANCCQNSENQNMLYDSIVKEYIVELLYSSVPKVGAYLNPFLSSLFVCSTKRRLWLSLAF